MAETLFGAAALPAIMSEGIVIAEAVPATAGIIGAGGALTAGGAMTALGAGGTLIGGVNAFSSSQQQQAMLKANANQAQYDAEQARLIGERNALSIEQRYAYEAGLSEAEFKREQARRRTLLAAEDGGGLSDLEIMSGLAVQHEQDLLSLDYTGRSEAAAARYGGESSYSSRMAEAGIYGMQARRARTQGFADTATTLLAGGAKTYRSYRGL